ncbi:MAG: 2-oxoacid:acceptor oxidoreductase family protein [Deltaproteobacteria bacterium]|nr:2-oxoacid:acceptor oxidoreductase family protein [Deltaproteobacteria bacterium]
MHEIRIHGRGGQGAVLASRILAKALVEEGKSVKAIPSFGFERRGAPVAAFLRFDDKVIRQATNIYHPNCIICLDPTLPRSVDIFSGMNPKGVWIQATKKTLDQLAFPQTVSKVGLCDAFGIALDTGMVSVGSLCKGMESVAFRDAALDKNIQAVHRGYEETKVFDINGQGIS